MKGVEIHDLHPQGFLAFDLKDILRSLGNDALERFWRCENIECTGEATQELELVENARAWISGLELLAIAERATQVICGNFLGRRAGELSDSLRISAIDSSCWEVFADDPCLAKLSASFRNVRTTQYDAR